MDTCEECSGQVAVIVDISKGIIVPCPVCERNSKIIVTVHPEDQEQPKRQEPKSVPDN